jgi:DNA-binding transcriptional LysR family regulator
MINLADAEVLVEAVASGSLAAAARRLGIAPMVASRRLAALEAELGVRLVHRTTRALSLTTAGEAFLPHARALLEGEAGARDAVRPEALGASGLLRISASSAFARKVIAPLLPAFLAAHPALRVELVVTDLRLDLAADGVDLAIRVGKPLENSQMARRLGDSQRQLFAAPTYLAARGCPRILADLADHDCLIQTSLPYWDFLFDGRVLHHRVDGRLIANSIDALQAACIAGAGIACMAAWNVAQEVKAGLLVPVELADALVEPWGIWAITPSPRLIPPKVRLFIAALQEWL